ncbi:MAG: hypothetical protein HY000_26585, partial [Planctomycetes bacterium]|nr:hypothetical protein [Planctomycetota bacterium]
MDLRSAHSGGDQFHLVGRGWILNPADGSRGVELSAEVNQLRGDWRLFYATSTPEGPVQHTVGYVIFSDRVDGSFFGQSGKFYLAPGTENGLLLDTSASA